MHPIFFSVKRVHLEAVRFIDEIMGYTGLTPARFDLMRILEVHSHGMVQGTVAWLLGVSAPVVSRMVKALEERGYLTRTRLERDKRCLLVALTERGKLLLRTATSAVASERQDEFTAARVATGDRRFLATELGSIEEIIHGARHAVAKLANTLLDMRAALLDRAPFEHPWMPVDQQLTPRAFTTVGDPPRDLDDDGPFARHLVELC